MDKEKIKYLKILFEKRKKYILKSKQIGELLDKEIVSFFGFNYSETDDAKLIDTLDYGTDNIDFNDFFELMNYYKKTK